MMKSNVKKVIVTLIAILLVIGVAGTTYATNNIDNDIAEIAGILSNQTGNIVDDGNLEDIPEGNKTALNTNKNVSAGNTNVNENLPSTTPHAGVGDYSGLVFVAVFAVAAVYAYKKVKEYNA